MRANAAERKIAEDAMTLPADLVALITRPRPENEAGPPHWSHVDLKEFERFLDQLRAPRIAAGGPAPPVEILSRPGGAGEAEWASSKGGQPPSGAPARGRKVGSSKTSRMRKG